MSKLRTLTWNIGGGKLLADGADPSLIASYNKDGIEDIARLIKDSAADIVALQEVHQRDEYDQITAIADLAGYQHHFYDSTSDSHIEKGFQLGHGILSKYPISNHTFALFENPHLRVEWEDGSIAKSFDKGFSSCEIDANGTSITVFTLHLVPFRRFKLDMDSETAKRILNNVSMLVNPENSRSLIMGDFNINGSHIEPYLPSLFSKYGLSEVAIDEPTTPKARSYDHVLYKGLSFDSKVIRCDVLTDHYPVICDFSIQMN